MFKKIDFISESGWTASTRVTRWDDDKDDNNNDYRNVGIQYNPETDSNDDNDDDKRNGGIQFHQKNNDDADGKEEMTPSSKEDGDRLAEEE